MKKRNFTLVELLVVIMIIAVLASMLLPALKVAKDTAKNIVCLNNQKTIYTANFSYGVDYNDFIPPSDKRTQVGLPLVWRLGYMGCPYSESFNESTGFLRGNVLPDKRNRKAASILRCSLLSQFNSQPNYYATQLRNGSLDAANNLEIKDASNRIIAYMPQLRFSLIRPSILFYTERVKSTGVNKNLNDAHPNGHVNILLLNGAVQSMHQLNVNADWKLWGWSSSGNSKLNPR